MRFSDNRVTMIKDQVPDPDTMEQLMSVDLDVRATTRTVAAQPFSKDRFRPALNRVSVRARRHGRTRLQGVAKSYDKPWETKDAIDQ